jgi:hypothetical protein
MRFTEISESTTAGSVSTVAMPLGKTQTRTQVSGLEPVQKVMGGTAKKKGPYGNSLTEGAMKQLSMDLKELKDEEFKKKYNMTKQEARKELSAKPEPIKEAELSEDDIILVPGQGRKLKTGFIPHGKSRVDHEVEMARSDLFSAAKNAKQVYEMIQSVTEDEGLEGWVQEKIIKANDYLNTIREYLEGKQIQQESVVEGVRVDTLVTDALKIMRGAELTDAVKALKTVLGDRAYNERRGFYNFYIKQLVDMYSQQSIAEGKIDFAKKIQKNVDKSNKAVVKTKKEVGARIADIGAGGKEHNVKTDKAWDDAQKAKKAK